VVSFIVTGSLGLTPPLLIRYAFLKRPISKKTSSWLAASFCVFFWIAFCVFITAFGYRLSIALGCVWDRGVFVDLYGAGAGLELFNQTVWLVWGITFFVGRWIMSCGYVASTSDTVPATESPTEEAPIEALLVEPSDVDDNKWRQRYLAHLAGGS
jgi:hypothetical protein